MLSSDLVRARRRGERLHLQALKGADRESAAAIAAALIAAAQASLEAAVEEVNENLALVPREAREEKLWAGLKKLLLDRCTFGSAIEIDAPALRREIFELAARAREQAESLESFDREELLAQVAEKHQISREDVEQGLFSDLKGAQRLSHVSAISAQGLVEQYDLAQVQGVLLKAVSLTVEVHCSSPDAYRHLFQKLKFRRLLYQLTKLEGGGYRLEIDGPFSLFESVTKYGLGLALIVPALRLCDRFELEAKIKWGKERKALVFQDKWKKASESTESDADEYLRPEVSALLEALKKKKSPYKASSSEELLDIPGVGLCIPDLKFTREGEDPIYLEVLGFWSRDAVFRRIEWAESPGSDRVIFCVSTRLRVSQELLDDASGSSLYVYKGTMSAAAVLSQLESLSARG